MNIFLFYYYIHYVFFNWRVTSDYQIYAWQNYNVKMP